MAADPRRRRRVSSLRYAPVLLRVVPIMKPKGLKVGDRFRVAESCDPGELVDTYTVLTEPTGNHVLSFEVENGTDKTRHPMHIGAWVHLHIIVENKKE